jgi:hypothetical protein
MDQETVHRLIVVIDELNAGLMIAGTKLIQRALVVRLRHAFSVGSSNGLSDRLFHVTRTWSPRCWRKKIVPPLHCQRLRFR